MPWYNPSTWTVVDNVQGQNDPSYIQPGTPGGSMGGGTSGGGGGGGGGGAYVPPQVNGAATTTPNNLNTGTRGTGGTGGNTAPRPVLNTAAIANTQKSIDQLPLILQQALADSLQEYENAKQKLGVQETQQRGAYDTGTTTNQQNYDANLMASLRSGAKGLGGLLSILRGTGAENWARDAVMETTNSDIRGGLDTRNQNQTSLDSSLSGFLTELEGKRNANDQTLRNNEYAARGANATQAQKLYSDMASVYADAEDTGNATKFMNKAGDYSGDIARYSTAPVSKFDTVPVPVKAAEVSAFADPTKQAVSATEGNQGGGAGIFTLGDTRRKLAGAGA